MAENRGSCVQACGVMYEGTPLVFVDIRSRYLFSKTSIDCKIRTIAFFVCIICFVSLCLLYTRDYIDYE